MQEGFAWTLMPPRRLRCSCKGHDRVNAGGPKLDDLVDTYNIDTVTEHYKRLEFIEKLASRVALQDAMVLELGCRGSSTSS
jgi:hypothetical protein